MFRLSLRNLLAKKLRLLTTAIAIVLGVAFTAGTMILADTVTVSLSTAIDDIADGVDTVVRGERLGETETFTPRAPVPIDALDRVLAVDGVAVAVPYWEGYTQVIGVDGKVLDLPQSFGFNWIDDEQLTMFELVAGRAPETIGEVVLGSATADAAGVAIGDHVDLVTTQGRETFTVTGLSQFDGGASFGDTAFAFFHDDDAAVRLGEPGTTDAVLARSDGSVDEVALTAAIAAVVPTADVVTGSDQAAEQKSNLSDMVGLIETILLVFGGIALFVGSFTIANTFTITVAQRTKELALVRAVGASRRQVLGSVVIEAGLLGLLAAALGLVGGLGVAKGLVSLFGAIGMEFPARALVIETGTVVVAFAAGILVTVVAALVPAHRAATVAPIDAMRDASIERLGTSRRRVALGGGLGLIGGAALVAGVAQGSAAIVGLGSVTAFLSSIALGPVLVRPVTALVAAPMRRMGVTGRLAAANAVRNPKRSAATAAALTIGVMLVAAASMFASTARSTIVGDTAEVLTADRVVRPVGMNPGVPVDLAGTIGDVDGAQALPVQVTVARVDGEIDDVAGLDLVSAGDAGLVSLDVIEGAFASNPALLAVGDQHAADRGWSVGDAVEVAFADGTVSTMSIGAIFDQTVVLPPVIAPYGVVAPHGDGFDRLVLVAGDDAAIAAVDAAMAAAPTALLDTVEGYAASLAGALDMMLTLVLGFLGLAVVIAVLGIATTIGLSVHERTRELGVLRAVGMSRRQLRRSIRLESIVIALFGTVLGLVMGIGFAWATLGTLEAQGFAAPVVPTGTLVVITVGALLAGVLAAALPARRAGRLAVLDAVRTA